MSLSRFVAAGAERLGMPDAWILSSLDRAVAQRAGSLAPSATAAGHFAAWMNGQPGTKIVVPETNLPPAFYETFLGPQMHMGSGHYVTAHENLAAAEQHALHDGCALAGLADGQEILDLGCGWGAATLLAAETHGLAHVTAFTSSPLQAAYVQARATARGLQNVTVKCGDLASFTPNTLFDRVICMDMMEAVTNWRSLLIRLRGWMTEDSRLFAQMPTHITTPYCLEKAGTAPAAFAALTAPAIMPSQGLIHQFNDLFTVETEQHWSGAHAARTALQWLANFDQNHGKAGKLLRAAYGGRAESKRHEWRMLFLEMARMYGHAFGNVWGVGQYVMSPCLTAGDGDMAGFALGSAAAVSH